MRRLPSLIIVGLLTLTLAGCGPGQPAAIQTPQPASTTVPVSSSLTATPTGQATSLHATPPVAPTQASVATTTPSTAPAGPQRITFAPGTTTGNVEGAIVRGTEQRYVLGARSGQLMQVQVSALEQNAVFSVFDPSGQPLAGTEPGRDATDWSGTLPATGDYQITVGATRGNASFKLDVTITDPRAQDQSIRTVDWNAVMNRSG
jgi:hypothetical protein